MATEFEELKFHYRVRGTEEEPVKFVESIEKVENDNLIRIVSEYETGEKTEICNVEEFTRIELSGGETIRLYANLDKLEEEFLRVASEDEKPSYYANKI